MFMKKLTIFANCQGEAILNYLTELGFENEFELLKIEPIQNLRGKDIARVESVISKSDVILAQHISDEYFIKRFSSNKLLKLAKSDALIIRFPNFYFDGLFPHLSMLRGVRSALNLVHDYHIVAGCLRGIPQSEIVDFLHDKDAYNTELSQSLFISSLTELKRREQDFDLMKGSDLIEENYKNVRLFNQFNHPSRAFFKLFFDRLAEYPMLSGLNRLELAGEDYLDHIKCPLYPSTVENLKLNYENPLEYNCISGALNTAAVVKRFYHDYTNTDSSILREALTLKPWVESNLTRFGF